LLVVAADSNDAELMEFMDAALEDTEGWKE